MHTLHSFCCCYVSLKKLELWAEANEPNQARYLQEEVGPPFSKEVDVGADLTTGDTASKQRAGKGQQLGLPHSGSSLASSYSIVIVSLVAVQVAGPACRRAAGHLMTEATSLLGNLACPLSQPFHIGGNGNSSCASYD